MDNWDITNLSAVTSILGDGLHGTPIYDEDGEYYFINGNNLVNGRIEVSNKDKKVSKPEFEKYKKTLNDRTILVSINGTLGNVAFYNNEKIVLGKSACYFNLLDSVDKYYVRYVLESDLFKKYINTFATGSIIKNISLKQMRDFEFRLPPLHIQKKLSYVLSTLDEKIALNNQINATLEQMAKTLYDYWFVQFDFPDDNGNPYKSSGGEMVYNETLKRDIPKGWEVKSLWQIANYFNGLALQKYRPTDEEYLPVIKIREMNEGISSNTEKASPDIPQNAIIDDGDILFSWSASLDVMIWNQGKGALNQHIFKVTSEQYPKSFYYFELLNYLKHFKMMAELRKTTMGHITQDHLKQAYICIPKIELLEVMENKLKPIFDKNLILHKENRQLAKLRDWLLPMLMNGQVTVQ